MSQKVCHKMYVTKCMSQNVCHKMYVTKCMSQNVCHKMYVSISHILKINQKIETNRMELKMRYDEVFVQR
jgi:hypothetical protein